MSARGVTFPTLAAVVLAAFSAVPLNAQIDPSRRPLASQTAPDGVLKPWRESRAATSESGLIARLNVKLGDRVEIGQPLAELDCEAVQIQLQMAQVQAETTGRIQTAQAEVEFSKSKLDTLQALAARQHAFPSELEKAQADLQMAQGRLESELQERRIYGMQVEKLKQQLRDRTIYAPIKGIVVELYRELGEHVAPNAPHVVRIADVSKLKASFYLMDHEVARIANEKIVKVSLPSGTTVPATVEYIAPVADGESGLIEVRVAVDNPTCENLGSRCSLLFDDLGSQVEGSPKTVMSK